MVVGAEPDKGAEPPVKTSEVQPTIHSAIPLTPCTDNDFTVMLLHAGSEIDGAELLENDNDELTRIVRRAWEVAYSTSEVMPTRLSLADTMAIESIDESLIRLPSGAWEAGTIWRGGEPALDCNQYPVKMISQRIEASMARKPGMADMARLTIEGWLSDEYVRRLPEEEERKQEGHYLSIFGVSKIDRETTKLRMVINAAQRFKQEDGTMKCLNDCMLSGPKLQVDIVKITLRMKLKPVAFMMDFKAMFMRFRLREEDRKYHRFYYGGQAYEFLRWPFGAKAAPFVALYITNHIAKLCQDDDIQTLIKESLYVDDICASRETVEEAIKLVTSTVDEFANNDLHLLKLMSNDRTVAECLPEFRRTKNTTGEHMVLGTMWDTDKDVFKYPRYALKPWDDETNRKTMLQQTASIYDPCGGACPLTVIGHALVQEGHSLKHTHGLEWETLAVKHIGSPPVADWLKRWNKFVTLANQLHKLTFPRYVGLKDAKEVSLHVFCDGSKLAYAGAAYLRVSSGDDPDLVSDREEESLKTLADQIKLTGTVKVSLIQARKTLCPTRPRTMPQTELMGALIAAEMAKDLATTLNIESSKVFLWCDSKCVLSWIQKPAIPREVFVVYRVSVAHNLTYTYEWNYVNTKDNPADIPTRGASVDELNNTTMWKSGPWFLSLPTHLWPKQKITVTEEDVYTQADMDKAVCQTVTTDSNEGVEPPVHLNPVWGITDFAQFTALGDNEDTWRPAEIQMKAIKEMRLNAKIFTSIRGTDNNVSKWTVLVRAWATMFTLQEAFRPTSLANTRNHKHEKPSRSNKKRLFRAACAIIAEAQVEAFAPDLDFYEKKARWMPNSTLEKVAAYVDQMGVLRAQGRTKMQEGTPPLVRHPIILNGKDKCSVLIIRQEHERLGHNQGVAKLQMAVQQKFYIRAARERCKAVDRACVTCQKIRKKPAQQLMGIPFDLKMGSTVSIKPFSIVSLDFAGPYYVTLNRSRLKAYFLVVTCLQVKAIHLEMTIGCTADSVLAALERTTNRRGDIERCHSDNGSSFVKARSVITQIQTEQEMRDELGEVDWVKVSESCEEVGIHKWSFSAPRSPEGNGAAEAMVKLAKKALQDTFREVKLTYDEFRTVLVKAEAKVNSRPLGVIPADHWEAIEIMTPQHLLTGRLGTAFAPRVPVE
jgi:hypothetical protein